jgi:hypothetical protein
MSNIRVKCYGKIPNDVFKKAVKQFEEEKSQFEKDRERGFDLTLLIHNPYHFKF